MDVPWHHSLSRVKPQNIDSKRDHKPLIYLEIGPMVTVFQIYIHFFLLLFLFFFSKEPAQLLSTIFFTCLFRNCFHSLHRQREKKRWNLYIIIADLNCMWKDRLNRSPPSTILSSLSCSLCVLLISFLFQLSIAVDILLKENLIFFCCISAL